MIYTLIGRIQEETHRFAIEYHRNLRGKAMKKSALDDIPGIGPKRREALLKHFKTIKAIREASPEELGIVLPKDASQAVYDHFHRKAEEPCELSQEAAEE